MKNTQYITAKPGPQLTRIAKYLNLSEADVCERIADFLMENELVAPDLEDFGREMRYVARMHDLTPIGVCAMVLGTVVEQMVSDLMNIVLIHPDNECEVCGYEVYTTIEAAHGKEWHDTRCQNPYCRSRVSTEPTFPEHINEDER